MRSTLTLAALILLAGYTNTIINAMPDWLLTGLSILTLLAIWVGLYLALRAWSNQRG